ncbi:MAG: hypothetical protein JWP13_223 [Candidatus Saccharibacteria bacterium]|nr:hypothetical protein [Candidatus Saccharibacteria bacterium]
MLFRQSFSVLIGNKYLLRYLLMTGLWVLLITVAMVGLYLFIDWKSPKTYSVDKNSGREFTSLLGFGMLFINYILVYFVINFYAAGLTANVLDIFQGQRRPYQIYIGVARKKAPTLFFYSAIAATVGVLLQYIAERVRWVGWLISWFLGTLWSLGTLFVVPIIITSESGAPTAIKQSVKFFKTTWGENITAKVTVNFPLFLIQLSLMAVFIPLAFFLTAITGHIEVFIGVFIVYILCSLTVAVIGSFANSLINIALFYFAAYRQVPPAFSADLLNSIFVPRKPNRLLQKLRG